MMMVKEFMNTLSVLIAQWNKGQHKQEIFCKVLCKQHRLGLDFCFCQY